MITQLRCRTAEVQDLLGASWRKPDAANLANNIIQTAGSRHLQCCIQLACNKDSGPVCNL